MIDTTRSLRIIGSRADHNGPARLIAVDGDEIIVRSRGGKLGAFDRKSGKSTAERRTLATIRLENEPIRTTARMYARRSAARPNEIKLQTVRPQVSIGEIEIDVEGDRIVGARVVS